MAAAQPDPNPSEAAPDASGGTEELYALVYGELQARARRLLVPGSNHTLQATALVHEAWLKLDGKPAIRDRSHFLAVASAAMRSVLVDHARRKGSTKRPDAQARVLLDEALAVYADRVPDVLELHEELTRLAELDARMAQVVELRFFGGLSIADAAAALCVSHATVERDWQAARAWLAGRLQPEEDERG